MRRSLLAILVLAAACGGDNIPADAPHADASHADASHADAAQADAPPVDGAGSGSDVAALEASPRDHGLELMVVAASMVVVVGPLGGARRRRKRDARRSA